MQNSSFSLIKRLAAGLIVCMSAPQVIRGMDVQVKQPEIEAPQQEEVVQQQATETKPEVFVTLVTSEGKPNEKRFSVPLSFIKASKMLNGEFQRALSPNGNHAESTETNGDETHTAQLATLSSTMISSNVFALLEPHLTLIGKLHTLRKLRHHLSHEITFVNSSGLYASMYDAADGEPEKERRNKELFFKKYPTVKTFTLNECKAAIAALRAQIKGLNQERAEIYSTLYSALKELSLEQLQDLMLLADFCEIKTLESFLIALAFRLTDEELSQLPAHLVEKVRQKKAGQRASILHWACARGMLKVLHDNYNQSAFWTHEKKNSRGNTPLNYAACNGHADCVQYFLVHSRNFAHLASLWNHAGYTPLLNACQYGHTSLVELLLGKGPYTGPHDESALHLAAGSKEVAELVYNHYHKLDDRDAGGDTPLTTAAKRQSEETVRFLLEKGANKRAANRGGRTALHIACNCPLPALSLVQTIVEAKCPVRDDEQAAAQVAFINAVDVNGMTALHCACTQKSLPVVQYLTQQNGVDVHQKDTKHGQTPLEFACSYRQLAVVKFLFEECGCGFEDLSDQTFAKYHAKIRAYLEEQKAAIARRAREQKEEQERLRARREQQKSNSK